MRLPEPAPQSLTSVNTKLMHSSAESIHLFVELLDKYFGNVSASINVAGLLSNHPAQLTMSDISMRCTDSAGL